VSSQSATHLNRIAFAGLCALLVWAPFPFGSRHVWAYTVLTILVFFSVILYLLDRARPTRQDPIIWIRTPATPFLGLFFILVLLQLTPLPDGAAAFLSPLAHLDKSTMTALLSDTPAAGADRPWMALAYAKGVTMREGMKAAACLLVFFLSLHLLRTKRRIDVLVAILIAVGVVQALYAVYQTFSVNPKIFWWASRSGEHGYASGTFTVSNHFCFYLEMLLPLAAGFGFSRIKRKRRFIPGLKQRKALIQRVVGWFAPESPNPSALAVGAGVLAMGIGLLMSASRGGILSLGAAAFIMAVLFFFRPEGRKNGLAILALCLVVVLYGLHIGIDPTLQKFERTESLASRLFTASTLLPIIGDYPWTGVGLGNLRYLYYRYTVLDPPVPYTGVWTAGHAHNDWLELFTETGMVGGGLVLAAYLVFLYKMIRIWRRRHHRHAVGIGAGAITGLLAVGFHSFFDFSMRIPANPATLAAVAAIGYAALHRRGPDYDESFFYRVRSFQPGPLPRGLAILCVLVPTAGMIYLSISHFQAERHCPTQYNSTLNLNYTPYLSDIETAIDRFPWRHEYHLSRARFYLRIPAATDGQRQQYARRAVQSLKQSLRLNPAQPYAWYLLGRQYARRNDNPSAYFDHWLPLADQCMDMSVGYAPREESTLARAALYWTWRAAVLPGGRRQRAEDGETEGQRDKGTKGQRTATHNSSPITSHFSPFTSRRQAIDKFQSLFQRYLTLAPGRWEWAAEQVHAYHPDPGVLMGLAPEGDEETARRILRWTVGADSPRPEDAGP